MNTITWFKNYLQELQNTIEAPENILGINSNRVVLDDSEVTKYLSELSELDNHLLIGVMPSFNSTGTDADSHQLKGYTQLLLLKKTSYSSNNYDDYIAIFEDAFEIATLIVNKLIKDAQEGKCNFLSLLNTNTIQIVPVWNKSACNGWNILFSFDKFI